MKKMIILGLITLMAPLTLSADSDVKIGKQNITVKDGRMTPEALWAMGRISAYAASPDGSKLVYQVGYYSVKHNKSHHVLYMMNADGSNKQLLTKGDKNETDAAWLDNETVAFKFSPDGKHVIILKSIPFHEVIKKNPSDLPKATGRLVTDLMYRHWDHYVESIQHPFVFSVGDGFSIADNGTDILEGEPYECPMEPFGGIEQLAWSTDSKQIAYTCRKKTGTQYSISTDSDIFLYNIGTRETKNLCKPANYVEPIRSFRPTAATWPGSLWSATATRLTVCVCAVTT